MFEFKIVSNVLPDLEIIKLTQKNFFCNLILVVSYLQKGNFFLFYVLKTGR